MTYEKKFEILCRRALAPDIPKIKEYCEKVGVTFREDATAAFIAEQNSEIVGVSFLLQVWHAEPHYADSVHISRILFEKTLALASHYSDKVFMTVPEENKKVWQALEKYGAVTVGNNARLLERST